MKWFLILLETGAAAICVALAIAFNGLVVEPAAWILCGVCIFAAIISALLEKEDK